MRRRWTLTPLLVAALGLAPGCTTPEPTGAGRDTALEQVLIGKRVYNQHCAGCHGVKGDGEGPAARFLDPRPRDFVDATYKFRSTPSGYLPTDQDLYRTVTNGVHTTSMPSWRLLSERDRWAVIAYLKTFSERWEDPDEHHPALPMPGPPEYVDSDDSIRQGFDLYAQMQCASCHGLDGSGEGAKISGDQLTDNKGNVIRPLNFSLRSPKGGSAPEDYYRAFTTGLDGTPMPSYGGGTLDDEQRWHLVSYVRALKKYKGKIPSHLTGAEGGDE